jgi:hypothetical protein
VRALGERTLTYALVNIGVRLLVWVLPVLLYLHFVDHVEPIEYLRLKQRWKRGLQIGLGFTCVNFLLLLIRFGMPNPNAQSITWNNVLSTSLLIGFVEELPYRGFILQKASGAVELLGCERGLIAALPSHPSAGLDFTSYAECRNFRLRVYLWDADVHCLQILRFALERYHCA